MKKIKNFGKTFLHYDIRLTKNFRCLNSDKRFTSLVQVDYFRIDKNLII